MVRWVWITLGVMLIFIVGYVGGVAGARKAAPWAVAFGQNDKDKLFYKIKVDTKGHVICSDEEGGG